MLHKAQSLLVMLLVVGAASRDARAVPVTFQVDAASLLEACQIGPESADPSAALFIVGSFNNWTPGEAELSDEDADGIYDVTIDIEPGTYQFKVYHSAHQWEDGSDRTLTVGDEEVTLDPITYRKTVPNACGSTLGCLDVHFRVDMAPQIISGEFVPGADLVTVAGPFNGWNSSADTLVAEPPDYNIYSKVITLDDQLIPGEVEHKFVRSNNGEFNGWEEFEGNRYLAVTGEEPDDDSNGCLDIRLDEPPFFSNVAYDDLFSQDATLTLELDLRPAFYFLADSSYIPGTPENLPIDRLDGFDAVFVNGPLAGGWAVSWTPQGLGARTERRLWDDGTNGDAVAGDSIFTWQTTFLAGESRRTTFKFGLDGYDNENAGGADHRMMLPDEADARIRVVFGAARQLDGTYQIALYNPYISVEDDEALVVRRDGNTQPVSAERAELPGSIALGQNYPNPFNPSTSFSYRVDAPGHVSLRLFDATGRHIRTLFDGAQVAGTHTLRVRADDLPSGVYFYQLRAGGEVVTRPMILAR